MNGNALKVFIVLILALISIPQAFSQSADLIIYRDGVVHVKISMEVDKNLPYIRIPLIGVNVSNVIAYDENKELLNYEIENGEVEIYSLGCERIVFEYDTEDLTFKSRGLWTFKVDSPYEIKVVFPENSTIMGMNAIPKQISIEGSKVIMVFSPGYYEVDYVIPIAIEVGALQPSWIFPIAIVSMVVLAIAAISIKKGRRREGGGDEERVLNFIKKSGGRALEAEIRAAFPEIPRTTLWRMLKRLEKKGVVRIKKVGLQNVVELT